jgi:hypothetical protein
MSIWTPISLEAQPITPDRRTDGASKSNHQRYAPYLCSDGWSEMGQPSTTS